MNVLIYSEENFVWSSMQEIIPGLVDCWKEASKNLSQDFSVINIDQEKIQDHMPTILKAKNVILSSFNVRVANAVQLIREKLGVDARLHIHLHGLASVASWPLFEFGIGHLITDRDVFYSTCSRDLAAAELAFENAQIELIPFHNPNDASGEVHVMEKPTLVYIGRLSEQKNLHQLLWCCSLINQKYPDLEYELKIYGKTDGLGSPNMDLDSDGYDELLQQLKKDLKLNNVCFEGFVQREQLDKWVVEYRHIFISPSLHSDENFGIAALKSLAGGNPAILSDWGGHTDFKKIYKDVVSLVPVHKGEYGPCLDPSELVSIIVEKIKKYPVEVPTSNHYSFLKIVEQYESVLSADKKGSGTQLKRTQLAEKIHKKRNQLVGKRQCQCFADYLDSDAHALFEAYGMGNSISRTDVEGKIAPWVKEKSFVDPHKGKVENKGSDLLMNNGWLF